MYALSYLWCQIITVSSLKMSNSGCVVKNLTSPRERSAFAPGSWDVICKPWEGPA